MVESNPVVRWRLNQLPFHYARRCFGYCSRVSSILLYTQFIHSQVTSKSRLDLTFQCTNVLRFHIYWQCYDRPTLGRFKNLICISSVIRFKLVLVKYDLV